MSSPLWKNTYESGQKGKLWSKDVEKCIHFQSSRWDSANWEQVQNQLYPAWFDGSALPGDFGPAVENNDSENENDTNVETDFSSDSESNSDRDNN